jgi:nicotinamidase-related amidase
VPGLRENTNPGQDDEHCFSSKVISMSSPDTAVLLIDVQASFTARPYWSSAELPAYLDATARLLSGARAAGLPIVQVFHTDGPDRADNPFARASGLVRPLPGCPPSTPRGWWKSTATAPWSAPGWATGCMHTACAG